MDKNKLVIAMAAAALMSSMSAVANDADSFVAKYTVDDDITIQILEDEVALTSSDVDADDGYARGSTAFCVGRLGADTGGNGDFTVTVTSINSYQLAQGVELIPYQLHYTADTTFEEDDLITADADEILGTTTMNVATCDNDLQGTGYMWVSIPPSSMDLAVAGEYSDTVTMTVAPR